MAYLTSRPSGAVEIRESFRTPDGPRSRVLASFVGALTTRVLDLAEARATRSWSRSGLIARAREKGVRFARSLAGDLACQLLVDLRRNQSLDPNLVHLLKGELALLEAKELPVELEDVIDWLGADAAERAQALRGLLRLSDRIVRSRDLPLERPDSYPRLVPRTLEAA